MMRQKKDGLNTKIYVIKELRNSIGKAPTQWVKSLFAVKIWTIYACQDIYSILQRSNFEKKMSNCWGKVQIFWEGHKKLKKSPTLLLSNSKKRWEIFSNCLPSHNIWTLWQVLKIIVRLHNFGLNRVTPRQLYFFGPPTHIRLL
jgi:hypothetical protein